MKKMRNKKGFTLVELLVVIGIIVVLSGATIVGVVSWVNNAKNTKEKVLNSNGENFENDARLAVETFAGKAPEYVKEKETLNPITNTPAPGPVTETPTPGPVTQTPGTVTDTPKPGPVTQTPGTVTETPKPGTVTQKPGPVTQTPGTVTETPKPQSGRVGSETGTTPADGAGVSGGIYGLKFSLPCECKELTIWIDSDRISQLSCHSGNCNVSKSGHYYTIKMTGNHTVSSSGFGVSGNGDIGNFDTSKIIIVSYVPA